MSAMSEAKLRQGIEALIVAAEAEHDATLPFVQTPPRVSVVDLRLALNPPPAPHEQQSTEDTLIHATGFLT